MNARACPGCPNPHACQYGRACRRPDPMAEGTPAADFAGHPGVNAKQRASIAAAVAADPGARILGMDENERPVVRYRRYGETLDYAVLRSGEPADPGRVRERWAK